LRIRLRRAHSAQAGQPARKLFPNAQLQLINGARHYVQVDEPKAVADAILTAAAPLTRSNDNTNTPTPSTRPSSQPAP
jgi:hypothetical protein